MKSNTLVRSVRVACSSVVLGALLGAAALAASALSACETDGTTPNCAAPEGGPDGGDNCLTLPGDATSVTQ